MALGDDLGTIETGTLADLVLLDADPLVAIANTARIAAVLADGRLIEQADVQDLLPAFVQAPTPTASTGS